MARSDSSTQRLCDHIDQLDLALDQLAVADRNFDRFALMLVDNVVELTLHDFAQDRAFENELWRRLEEPKYDPQVVKEALGRRFDAKPRFAAKLGLISAEVCESLLLLHSFRNTAYHQGKRHEGILHSLAIFHFRNACDLVGAYKPSFWSSSSNDQIPYRARKYVGESPVLDSQEVVQAAFKRLEQVAASLAENLVGDLAADMALTIDRTDRDMQFLVDNSRDVTRDEIPVEVQAWLLAATDEGAQLAAAGGCSGTTQRERYAWLVKNHEWRISGDPIPAWRVRESALRAETDYHKALKRYCDFMSQTEQLRSQIHGAASDLDGAIQHQIDVARGK